MGKKSSIAWIDYMKAFDTQPHERILNILNIIV